MTDVYGAASCAFTAELCDDLEWRGIAYTVYDVERDPAALARMLALTGGARTIPVLVEDGRVVSTGYHGRGCVVGGS